MKQGNTKAFSQSEKLGVNLCLFRINKNSKLFFLQKK